MTKRLVGLTLSLFMALGALPNIAAAAAFGQASGTATIEGVAHDSNGKPMANKEVKARNVRSGQATSAKTDAAGRFRFGDLAPASYVVELLDGQKTVGTSVEIPLTNIPVAFVTVCASTKEQPKGTALLLTPAVLGAAAAVGITAAVVATRDEASPTR
jgi:carboxypeptidase family protein